MPQKLITQTSVETSAATRIAGLVAFMLSASIVIATFLTWAVFR